MTLYITSSDVKHAKTLLRHPFVWIRLKNNLMRESKPFSQFKLVSVAILTDKVPTWLESETSRSENATKLSLYSCEAGSNTDLCSATFVFFDLRFSLFTTTKSLASFNLRVNCFPRLDLHM